MEIARTDDIIFDDAEENGIRPEDVIFDDEPSSNAAPEQPKQDESKVRGLAPRKEGESFADYVKNNYGTHDTYNAAMRDAVNNVNEGATQAPEPTAEDIEDSRKSFEWLSDPNNLSFERKQTAQPTLDVNGRYKFYSTRGLNRGETTFSGDRYTATIAENPKDEGKFPDAYARVGIYVNIPQIYADDDGTVRLHTVEDAEKHYRSTGEHFGKFEGVDAADRAAEAGHHIGNAEAYLKSLEPPRNPNEQGISAKSAATADGPATPSTKFKTHFPLVDSVLNAPVVSLAVSGAKGVKDFLTSAAKMVARNVGGTGSESLMANDSVVSSVANGVMRGADWLDKAWDEHVPTEIEGAPIQSYFNGMVRGLAKFGYGGALNVPVDMDEAHYATKEEAIANGMSEEDAESLAICSGIGNGLLTGTLYYGPWSKLIGASAKTSLSPFVNPANRSFSGIVRAYQGTALRNGAEMQIKNTLAAASVIGVQGGFNEAIGQEARGEEIDPHEIILKGAESAVESAPAFLVMAGLHLAEDYGTVRQRARDGVLRFIYDTHSPHESSRAADTISNGKLLSAEGEVTSLEPSRSSEGKFNEQNIGAMVAMFPDGHARAADAILKGQKITPEMIDQCGLPKDFPKAEFIRYMEAAQKAVGVDIEQFAKYVIYNQTGVKVESPDEFAERNKDGDSTKSSDSGPEDSRSEVKPSEDVSESIKSANERAADAVWQKTGVPPKRFSPMVDVDGNPDFVEAEYSYGESGKTLKAKLLFPSDSGVNVAIKDNEDGTYTVFDGTLESGVAHSVDEALAMADALSIGMQSAKVDAAAKNRFIRVENAQNGDNANEYALQEAARQDAKDGEIIPFSADDGSERLFKVIRDDNTGVFEVMEVGPGGEELDTRESPDEDMAPVVTEGTNPEDDKRLVAMLPALTKRRMDYLAKGGKESDEEYRVILNMINNANAAKERIGTDEPEESVPVASDETSTPKSEKTPEAKEVSTEAAKHETSVKPTTDTAPAQTEGAKAPVGVQTKTRVAEPPKPEKADETPNAVAVTDAERAKYTYLPDDYIPLARDAERGAEKPFKSEAVSEFYHKRGMRYGIARDEDGEFHLVDPYTGDTHDEIRERTRGLEHRGAYSRQSTDADDFVIPFSSPKKTIPVGELSLDQIKAQGKKFEHDKPRRQRFLDDAFAFNEKFRKVESARMAEELNKAKGIDTLTRAVQEAGHLAEIGGESTPQVLTDALKDAKARLVDLKTSAGGMSGAEKNKALGIDAWPADDRDRRLAQGGVIKVPSSKADPLWDWFQLHKNDAGIQFLTKPFSGRGANDASELARELGITQDGDLDEETLTRLINEAYDARDRYQAWRKGEEEKLADKRAQAEHDVEVLSRGRKYDAIARGEKFIEDETQFNLDELEARAKSDAEYVAAKAFVENAADENDYAIMKPKYLAQANEEPGIVLRLDHEKQTFAIEHYDAKNGILTVFDPNDTEASSRRFQVTANDIKEITDDARTKEDAARNVPADAQKPGGGIQEVEGSARRVGGGRGASGSETSRESQRRAYAAFRSSTEENDDNFAKEAVRILGNGGVISVVDDSVKELTENDISEWEKSCVGIVIRTREDAAHLLERVSNPDFEFAKALYVSQDGRILKAKAFDRGAVGTATLSAQSIVDNAPRGTHGVIVSHNHPGGSVKPSTPDMLSCFHRAKVLYKNGIKYLEDIITDSNRFVSLGERNYWFEAVDEIAANKSFWVEDGTTVEQPESRYNVIPYEDRISLKESGASAFVALGNKIRMVDTKGSYLLGISDEGDVISAVKIGDGMKRHARTMSRANRFVVLSGSEETDRRGVVDYVNGIVRQNKNFGSLYGIVAVVPLEDGGSFIYNEAENVENEYLAGNDLPMAPATNIQEKNEGKAKPEGVSGNQDQGAESKQEKKVEKKRETSEKKPSAKKTVTSKLNEAQKKKALAGLDKLADVLKAPMAKLADDDVVKKIVTKFGTTKDIGHTLLVTPTGAQVSDDHGFVGHDVFGKLVVQDLNDRMRVWEESHDNWPSDKVADAFKAKVKGIMPRAAAQKLYNENHVFGDGTMTVDGAINAAQRHVSSGGISELLKHGVMRVASHHGEVEIGARLSPAQKDFVRAYADWHRANSGSGFSVDFVNADGYTASQFYPKHTSASRILDDADTFFATGKIESKTSALAEFMRAPIAPLEGGVEGIFSGSKVDYATRVGTRVDNAPALFAVGTGTGAAAYGWGLYGSKSRKTAEGYAGGAKKGTLVQQTWFTNRAPGDETHILDWSGPVSSANSKRIRDEWKREFDEKLPQSVKLTSGASAYNGLVRELGSNVEASMFLNRAGVDGTKSGDLYVTFSADNIRVDHKWKDGEQQYAPVESVSDARELTKEDKRKLRDATEDIVDALKEAGMGDLESVARYIAENSPETYAKVKPYLKNAFNSATDGDVTAEQANAIYGIIDKEIANERDESGESGAADNGEDRGQPTGAGSDEVQSRVGVDGQEPAHRGPRAGGSDAVADGVGASPRPAHADGGRADATGDARNVDGAGRKEPSVSGGQPEGARPGRGVDGDTDPGEPVRAGGIQDIPTSGAVAEQVEVSPGFMLYTPPEDLPVKAPSSQSLIVETSALASINPPKIERKPDIPDDIPARGDLQSHQYQSVCQAVNAHEKMLPNGTRLGYFVADGTGCGKTRIIGGIMLDGIRRGLGNGRMLIVSQKEGLFGDAQKDFAPFGISDKLLKLEAKEVGKQSPLLVRGQGIAFTTYGRLADNYQDTDENGTVRFGKKREGCQFADIVKWLGGTDPKEYDGIIALDEAHTASKEDTKNKQRTQRTLAQTVIDLQRVLPKARIVYLTATSAYNAADLRFVQRLGLWGGEDGFKNYSEFVSAFGDGNVSLMEVMTQGLKARGLYCNRSISFKGVKCSRVTHKCTPEQKAVQDSVRDMLFTIHDKIAEVCSHTGCPVGIPQKGFFGASLRFFGSLMTSFKVQSAIEIGKQALKDGKCPVFQIIETGDSAKREKASKLGISARKSRKKSSSASSLFLFNDFANSTPADKEDVEVSVKDKVIKFLRNEFPVREYLGVNPDTKKIEWGEEVAEAVEIRDALIQEANTLPSVGNPIDTLRNAFGLDGVSVVKGGISEKKKAEAIEAFNNGGNSVLIFSGAGGTGSSYHASPKFKNQRQRVQIPIEFGWETDKFIQALGRTHRNNQVVPPEFVLLTTDLPGEMRFMSTIAARVSSMGAIVGGDRNSSGQVVRASDSIDNPYGRAAIREFADLVQLGRSYADIPANKIIGEMLLSQKNLEDLDADKFLGHLQFMDYADQNAIFDAIVKSTASRIEEAKDKGEYDDGIKKIKAKRTIVKGREPLKKEDGTPFNVDIVTVGEWKDSKRMSTDDLVTRAQGEHSRITYARNNRSGILYGFINGADGEIRQHSPERGYVGVVEQLDYRSNFTPVTEKDAVAEWSEKYGAAPAETEVEAKYITGDLFPVWSKIGVSHPSVLRGIPQNSKPFIGVRLEGYQLMTALYGFGLVDRARKLFEENGFAWLKSGAVYPLGFGKDEERARIMVGTVSGRRSLIVRNASERSGLGMALTSYIEGWKKVWWKDPDDSLAKNEQIFIYPLSNEGAEQAYDDVVEYDGVLIRDGNKVVFSSRDNIGPIDLKRTVDIGADGQEIETVNVNPDSYDRDGTARNAGGNKAVGGAGGSFAASIGMPNMRIASNNGKVEFHPGRGGFKNKNALKRALGGVDAITTKGEPYVQLKALKLVKNGTDWFYSIDANKIPADVRDRILGEADTQKSAIELLNINSNIREMMKHPDQVQSNLMFNIMRAELAPDALYARARESVASRAYKAYPDEYTDRMAKRTDDELAQLALKNPDSFGAINELYTRYTMKPTKDKNLAGMIRQICGTYKPKPSEIEDIESAIWNHPSEHGGILSEIRNGNTDLFAKGFQKVLWDKARRFSKDFIRKAADEASRTVHTDAKREDFNEDQTAQLIAKDFDNAGFADASDEVHANWERNGRMDSRKELAYILDELERAGLPEKYMTWMRNYLAAVKDVTGEAYAKLADEFAAFHNDPTTNRREELEGMVQTHIKRNLMRRLGELGKRPEKLFAYEFENMLSGIRVFLNTNNPIALPGIEFDSREYTNEDLIEIMDENEDYDMADVCSLREKGMVGEKIAKELDMSHENVRKILSRARKEYGYIYTGENAGAKQGDWFDLLNVKQEIPRTEKGASKPKKIKSGLKQAAFDLGVPEPEPIEEVTPFVDKTDVEKIVGMVDDMIAMGNSDAEDIVFTAKNVLGSSVEEDSIRNYVKTALSKRGISTATVADEAFFKARAKNTDLMRGVMTSDDQVKISREIEAESKPKTERELEDYATYRLRFGTKMMDVAKELMKMGNIKRDKAIFIANRASIQARKQGKPTLSQDTMFASVEPLAETGGLPEYAGFWNEQIDAQRKLLGLPELKRNKNDKRTLEEIDRAAKAILHNEREFERNLSVWASQNYPVNAVEQAAIDRYGVKLARDLMNLREQQKAADVNGNFELANEYGLQIDGIMTKLDEAQRINEKIGRAWGLAGRARQMMYGYDMTLASYLGACIKDHGGTLPKDMRELASRLWERLKAQNLKLTEARMKSLESLMDAEIKTWLIKSKNADKKHTLGSPGAEKIERDYKSAIKILSYWAEKTSGVFQAVEGGQKLVRALERYHLLNGEGLDEDGAPNVNKMIVLLKDDLDKCGFDADVWEIRQMESRMGNATEPSPDEIERSVRDLHRQMLVSQQIAYILEHGELPPKTGLMRDEDSALVRELIRVRNKKIKENGLNAKDSEGRLASALKALKTRMRNKNEDVLRKIEILKAGGTLPEETKGAKITPDEELARLQTEYENNKRVLDALADPDGSKAAEKRVLATLKVLSDRKAALQELLDMAKADPDHFAWDKPDKPEADPRVVAAKAENEAIRRELKELHDALFPFGTDKELEAYYTRRLNGLNKAFEKWNNALQIAKSETSWQAKWDALHPTKRRQIPENDEIRTAKANVKQAYQACLDYRRKLKRDDTRGMRLLDWIRFAGSGSALIKTVADFSVSGVQGGRGLRIDPNAWRKAFVDGLKSFNGHASEVIVKNIAEHPYFEDFKAHGGHIYYMDGINGEVPEDFRIADYGPEILGKTIHLGELPVIKQSTRAFSGFLNRLNLEMYRNMVEYLGRNGEGATDNEKRDIARMVNTTNGYGYSNARSSGESLAAIAKVADGTLWAPRKTVAAIKFYSGWMFVEPWLGSSRHEKSWHEIWRVEKLTARNYARYLLGTIAFGICASLISWVLGSNKDDDENPNRISDIADFRSSELGRVKVGSTRVNVMGGGEIELRTLAQLLTGEKKVNGVVRNVSRWDVTTSYIKSKLVPWASTAFKYADGEGVGGQKPDYSAAGLARDLLMPISINNAFENFVKNDPLTAAILLVPTMTGMTSFSSTEDILKRASAQASDAEGRLTAADNAYDREAGDAMEAKLKPRDRAIGEANDVLTDEKTLASNEARLNELKALLKKTPLMDRRRAIEREMRDIEQENARLKEELPDRRKTAEERARKFKWDSVDRW